MRASALERLRGRFFAPVDIASLVAFRVAFGALMTWEALRYLAHGWVERDFVAPELHFTFFGFDWVRPPPEPGMTGLVVALAGLGLCIGAGLAYRAATVLFFAGFTWFFLVDQTYYLNHLYLVCLLSFLLCFLPLHRAGSVDAWLRPTLRADRIPGWPLHLLRLFLCQVYVFAGVAKLNPDWLRAQPLLTWLERRRDTPLFGPLLANDATAWAMSYCGMAFDLLVGPALLWRRTRPVALAAAVFFHVTNSTLFDIGIFPWMMLASTTLFLEPDWPRRLLRLPAAVVEAAPTRRPRLVVAGTLLWFAVHTALPLRHWLYPGDVSWTEEGHHFAWHMKLRDKQGRVRFRLLDPDTGERWVVHPHERLPKRHALRLRTQPDLILQYAHRLAEEARADGHARVIVHADVLVRLNGRPAQRLVDPRADLASTPRTLGPATWILPLREPLPGWSR